MASSYLHRIETVKERLGFRECPEGLLCYRCEMAKLHAEIHGSDWGGCDGKPSRFIDWSHNPTQQEISLAIADLTDAELEQSIADLRILAARQQRITCAEATPPNVSKGNDAC